jgi:hypothetical protein
MYDMFYTSRGFLMGDYFTKVILTIGQDYNVRKALLDSPIGNFRTNGSIERTESLRPYNLETLKESSLESREAKRPPILGAAYTLVGDDVLIVYVVCWSDGQIAPYFRAASSTGGWKISEDDTFDSDHLLFYCEEGSLVPKGPLESTRHMIWRGRVIDYLDYPRIRLFLPVKVETDTYSCTNVGRFDLLGKEARWVTGTSSNRARDLYSVAQVLQHIIVPRDIECLCPYTPKEIGGDGSYDEDPEFFSQVITSKSKDPAETLYRMERQLMKLWSHKYVVSDKPRGGVYKHDLILPTMDRLKGFLPERAVIIPPSKEHNELLSTLRHGILESPMVTFFKIVKRVYYGYLLKGILLPNLMVGSDVSSKRGRTSEASLWAYFDQDRLQTYLDRWRNPGFSCEDREPYYVVPYRHKDILSLGWTWKMLPDRPTEVSRIDVTSFLDVIMRGRDLPLVVDRLNMFFESDPLLLIRVREDNSIRGTIGLVSGDKKLAKRICDFVRANRDRTSKVVLIHPSIFFLGRIDEVVTDRNLFDQGAINFFGRTAGRSNLQAIVCESLHTTPERKYAGVFSVIPRGFATKPVTRRIDVRTEGPDIGHIEDLVVTNQNAVTAFGDLLMQQIQDGRGLSSDLPPEYGRLMEDVDDDIPRGYTRTPNGTVTVHYGLPDFIDDPPEYNLEG